MDADLVRGLRIPFDWGLEIGVLSKFTETTQQVVSAK